MKTSVTNKWSGATFSVGDTVLVFNKWLCTIMAVSSKKNTALVSGDFNGWTAGANMAVAG